MATRDQLRPQADERTPSGLTLAAGVVAVVVTALVTAPLTDAAGPRVGAMAGAVLLFSAVVGDGRAAVGVAVIAWAIGNGFLINQRGELRWHAPVDNWFTMGLLAAVAIGMIVAEIRGQTRRRSRWRPLQDLLETAAGEAHPADRSGRTSPADPRGVPQDGSAGTAPARHRH